MDQQQKINFLGLVLGIPRKSWDPRGLVLGILVKSWPEFQKRNNNNSSLVGPGPGGSQDFRGMSSTSPFKGFFPTTGIHDVPVEVRDVLTSLLSYFLIFLF